MEIGRFRLASSLLPDSLGGRRELFRVGPLRHGSDSNTRPFASLDFENSNLRQLPFIYTEVGDRAN